MKCEICGNILLNQNKCVKCQKNTFKRALLRNSINSENIKIYIGELLARESSEVILEIIKENPNIRYITLLSRGKYITRSIDMIEILKRYIKFDINYNTLTETKLNNSNKQINISVLIAKLKLL